MRKQKHEAEIIDILSMLEALIGGMPDVHSHQCPNMRCKHVWEHDGAKLDSSKAFHEGHTCPKCGDNSKGCYDKK